MRPQMALVELFIAVLVVGVSLVNASIPLAALTRTREARFVWVALGNLALAVFGSIAAWAELPASFAGPVGVPFYGLLCVLIAALLLMLSTVWPRRT